MLAYMHAMINPVIYITLNEKFRQEFTKAVFFGRTASTESKMIFEILACIGGFEIMHRGPSILIFYPMSDSLHTQVIIYPQKVIIHPQVVKQFPIFWQCQYFEKKHNPEIPSP